MRSRFGFLHEAKVLYTVGLGQRRHNRLQLPVLFLRPSYHSERMVATSIHSELVLNDLILKGHTYLDYVKRRRAGSGLKDVDIQPGPPVC